MDFDLTDLRVFAIAAATGSLSGAARELHLTQPSISERLRRLERLVGQPLFVRSSRGVSLAPAGTRLLPHAERCLALADRALDIARAEDTSGTVHVTTHASYAAQAVPFVLAAVRPLKFSIVVDDQHSEDAVHRIAAGSTDMAFTLPVSHAHEVRLQKFRTEQVIAVCHPDHPLAGRRCDIRRLGSHDIAVNFWGTGADAFRERLLDSPSRARRIHAVSPAETAAELARSGDAVGFLTRSTVERDLASRALVEVHVLDMPSWHVDIMLAYRRDRDSESSIAATIKALHAQRVGTDSPNDASPQTSYSDL